MPMKINLPELVRCSGSGVIAFIALEGAKFQAWQNSPRAPISVRVIEADDFEIERFEFPADERELATGFMLGLAYERQRVSQEEALAQPTLEEAVARWQDAAPADDNGVIIVE